MNPSKTPTRGNQGRRTRGGDGPGSPAPTRNMLPSFEAHAELGPMPCLNHPADLHPYGSGVHAGTAGTAVAEYGSYTGARSCSGSVSPDLLQDVDQGAAASSESWTAAQAAATADATAPVDGAIATPHSLPHHHHHIHHPAAVPGARGNAAGGVTAWRALPASTSVSRDMLCHGHGTRALQSALAAVLRRVAALQLENSRLQAALADRDALINRTMAADGTAPDPTPTPPAAAAAERTEGGCGHEGRRDGGPRGGAAGAAIGESSWYRAADNDSTESLLVSEAGDDGEPSPGPLVSFASFSSAAATSLRRLFGTSPDLGSLPGRAPGADRSAGGSEVGARSGTAVTLSCSDAGDATAAAAAAAAAGSWRSASGRRGGPRYAWRRSCTSDDVIPSDLHASVSAPAQWVDATGVPASPLPPPASLRLRVALAAAGVPMAAEPTAASDAAVRRPPAKASHAELLALNEHLLA
ncbi:hypothetical protein GPECTOR_45g99 [Gonium pectorale]|uniref:Uncharacterized protein n=1 Tax=Gonium pectorale TaxID=33097 RepID=A0A150G8Z4_GONPE|nr:hypothetical protein GPECTOR_45g99 [Gonium pectorale]|eukprot:KXZ46329.1 hypothetical protein GPECTOR_45g99 [Gonium pectorale]